MDKLNTFTLRLATEEDISALHALIEASVRGLQSGDYTQAQIDGALGTVLGLDTQLIRDGTYFVAEAVGGGEERTSGANALGFSADSDVRAKALTYPPLAGCGGWSKRKTLFGADRGPGRAPEFHPTDADLSVGTPGELDPATDAAKVRAIFVHPKFARRGLGSLILERVEAEAWAAGFRRYEMGSTLTGVPLYQLKGYVEVERIGVPLWNGEALPVVRMVKAAPAVRQSAPAVRQTPLCGRDSGPG